jgi:hypothetical protein
MKKQQLPKRIYVVNRLEKGEVEPFLIASEDSLGFDNDEIVGVYELVNTKRKQIAHELVDA